MQGCADPLAWLSLSLSLSLSLFLRHPSGLYAVNNNKPWPKFRLLQLMFMLKTKLSDADSTRRQRRCDEAHLCSLEALGLKLDRYQAVALCKALALGALLAIVAQHSLAD